MMKQNDDDANDNSNGSRKDESKTIVAATVATSLSLFESSSTLASKSSLLPTNSCSSNSRHLNDNVMYDDDMKDNENDGNDDDNDDTTTTQSITKEAATMTVPLSPTSWTSGTSSAPTIPRNSKKPDGIFSKSNHNSHKSSSSSSSVTSSQLIQQQPIQQPMSPLQDTLMDHVPGSPYNSKKVMNQLMLLPTNRSCADCKSTLIDPTQVYISISPFLSPSTIAAPTRRRRATKTQTIDTKTKNPIIPKSFRSHHRSFAPTNAMNDPLPTIHSYDDTNDDATTTTTTCSMDPPIDPALLASTYICGHGVFVCILCGAAHKLLGPDIAMVHSALSVSFAAANSTSNQDNLILTILLQSGGNAKATRVLEQYLSKEQDAAIRPKSTASIQDRLYFIRAKYHALAFVLPPCIGPNASYSWDEIIRHNYPAIWGTQGWAESIAFVPLATLEFCPIITTSSTSTPSSRGRLLMQQYNETNNNHSGKAQSLITNTSKETTKTKTKSKKSARPTLSKATTTTDNHMLMRQRSSELPDRFIDHFCVITASEQFDYRFVTEQQQQRQQSNHDTYFPNSPEDISLRPIVSDCFPSPSSHRMSNRSTTSDAAGDDNSATIPEHVGTFVFPEGCKPSLIQLSPSFYTFVLTNSMGDRLHGAVLRIYDTMYDMDWIRTIYEKHNSDDNTIDTNNDSATSNPSKDRKIELPPWLGVTKDCGNGGGGANRQSTGSNNNNDNADNGGNRNTNEGIFLPKCLVLLSHHPFFDIYRKFLLQLYRITLTNAPLPIERFIANFVREVPLPPPGKIHVKYGFTIHDMWVIERPPENQLPMTNFSYQPLFTTLSISNVLIIFGCLLQEIRIAVVSKHYSLLVPVCESLLSFLFPFHWQGMYLPVMPYSMLDILDAPVPYLVGLHSRYLKDVPSNKRPNGVVFVDLDNDIVHLGNDDDNDSTHYSNNHYNSSSTDFNDSGRHPPCFPERHVAKLKSKLQQYASSVYILPSNSTVGTVTSGTNERHIRNSERLGSYLLTELPNPMQSIRRKTVLENTDRAYKDNELLMPISGFLSEQGQFSERDMSTDVQQLQISNHTTKIFPFRNRLSKGVTPSNRNITDEVSVNLLDMDEVRLDVVFFC